MALNSAFAWTHGGWTGGTKTLSACKVSLSVLCRVQKKTVAPNTKLTLLLMNTCGFSRPHNTTKILPESKGSGTQSSNSLHTRQAVQLSWTLYTWRGPRTRAPARACEWAHIASVERCLRAHAGPGGLSWYTVTPACICALQMSSLLYKTMSLFILTFIKVACGPLTGASYIGVQQATSGFS